jgi:hypothetical protein
MVEKDGFSPAAKGVHDGQFVGREKVPRSDW